MNCPVTLDTIGTLNALYFYMHEPAIRAELAADKARRDRLDEERLAFETAMEFQRDDDAVRGVTRGCPRGTECV